MVETVTEERVVEVKEEVDMGEVVGTQSIAAKPLIDVTGPALQCCQVGPLYQTLV